MQYYLLVQPGYRLYNSQVHSVRNKLINDPSVTKIECENVDAVIKFINNNNDPKKLLLIYYHNYTNDIVWSIIRYLENIKQLKIKLVFFTFDYWYRPDQPYNKVWSNIYKASHHHVITFARDLDNLQQFHNYNLQPYSNNIKHFNLWCCYNDAFLPINNEPILKIAVSGAISSAYPERQQMLKFTNVIKLPFIKNEQKMKMSYNNRIHQYLCCFASSVYAAKKRTGKSINTHLILLKIYEILASGSLLLCPSSEESYLQEIGLESGTHYISSPMTEMQQTINYILDPNNRSTIDKIRQNGQNFAKQNFITDKRYQQLLELLKDI